MNDLAKTDKVENLVCPLRGHWVSFRLVDEQEQRALYRFQDNRVIARHLMAISCC